MRQLNKDQLTTRMYLEEPYYKSAAAFWPKHAGWMGGPLAV